MKHSLSLMTHIHYLYTRARGYDAVLTPEAVSTLEAAFAFLSITQLAGIPIRTPDVMGKGMRLSNKLDMQDVVLKCICRYVRQKMT